MKAKFLTTAIFLFILSPVFSQTSVIYTGLNTPIGLEAYGNDLYIAELQSNRIVKLNVSTNSPSLQVVSNINGAEGLALEGNKLRITNLTGTVKSLNVLAGIPTTTNTYHNTPGGVGARAITYNSTHGLFIGTAYQGNSTRIYRVNGASSSTLIATIPGPSGTDVRGLAIIGDYLYAAQRAQGTIYRIDLTQANPTPVVYKTGISLVNDLAALGSKLYFTTEGGRLYRINDVAVNNPPLTTLITGGFGSFGGIEIIGQSIYISGWASGGRIIKYTDSSIPTKLYVDNDATGVNNGSSWANAYTSLTSALQNASDNTEIWVAAGTYIPHSLNRNTSFTVNKNNLKIYGGFAGNETNLSGRDFSLIHTTNKTVLSGDLQGNDNSIISFNPNATRADNSLRVVNIIGNDVLIDGITISSGHANATSGEGRFGAGLSIGGDPSVFTIKNSVIEKNIAWWAAGLNLRSGASNSTIIVENCTIAYNLTSLGASAFYATSSASTTVDFTIANSLIRNNITMDDGTRLGSGSSGGWIRSGEPNSTINATVVNNTFVNNSNLGSGTSDMATLGMSRINGSLGAVNFANNIFWNNATNNSQVAFSIGRVADALLGQNIVVHNSIDQDGFSRINSNDRINTSTANPLFTNATSSDFSLQTSSPAKDAGDNSKIPVGINTDLLGNARIFNVTVDMGAYEFDEAVLGISNSNSLKSFTVFPNPVKESLYVDSEEHITKVEVYNYLGQIIAASDRTTVKTSHFAKGMYMLKVYTIDGKVGVKRFVKE